MRTETEDLTGLSDRYVAVWHEPDEARRRAIIESLWVPDGCHYSPTLEAHGYEELAARILRSHERWVIEEGCIFRRVGDVLEHHRTATFSWEMLAREGGDAISEGRDFFLLAPDGRLQAVYQYVLR
ncbi:MAG TPA: hypothetical protein VGI19_00710 [Candidatus Cybelea sp.]|jgi:hypothetical protein